MIDVQCDKCGGPCYMLGVLGCHLGHFRCRNCGWEVAIPGDELELDENDE